MDYFIKVLKSYADYNGRARRAEYWYFVLFNVIINFVVSFVAGFIGAPIIGTIVALIFLIPGIAVAVRRMHDVGKSGWYALIPLYNLILACTEGEKGANLYGADPKSVAEPLKV